MTTFASEVVATLGLELFAKFAMFRLLLFFVVDLFCCENCTASPLEKDRSFL